MAFRRGDHGVVELHWELTPSDWLRRLMTLNMDDLWQDARPFRRRATAGAAAFAP